MGRWNHTVKIKHLFSDEKDHASVQECMSAVADVLEQDTAFIGFRLFSKFRAIPQGDEFFGPQDYANKLLDALYDYADEHRIWIG